MVFRIFIISILSIFLISCGSGNVALIDEYSTESSIDEVNNSNPGNDTNNSGSGELIAPNFSESCGNALACSMHDKINEIRAANNKLALRIDSACQQAAQAHADDMAQNKYFSHIGLDSSTPSSRLRRYGGSGAGENIAFGPSNVNQVANIWMNSPGHASNILGNYRKSGLGAAFSSQGIYWVQCFTD